MGLFDGLGNFNPFAQGGLFGDITGGLGGGFGTGFLGGALGGAPNPFGGGGGFPNPFGGGGGGFPSPFGGGAPNPFGGGLLGGGGGGGNGGIGGLGMGSGWGNPPPTGRPDFLGNPWAQQPQQQPAIPPQLPWGPGFPQEGSWVDQPTRNSPQAGNPFSQGPGAFVPGGLQSRGGGMDTIRQPIQSPVQQQPMSNWGNQMGAIRYSGGVGSGPFGQRKQENVGNGWQNLPLPGPNAKYEAGGMIPDPWRG